MLLTTLLEDLTYTRLQGEMDKEITGVIFDSRKVEKDTLFVCIEGAVSDGHDYAAAAAASGAAVLIVSKEVTVPAGVTVLRVADTRFALACLSAAWFNHPAGRLTTVGITGTKGKTTTTYMVRDILMRSGHKVGLIGTIEAIIGDTHIPAANTTPESYLVQEYFLRMVEAGCDTVVMEVSSQALKLHRVSGFVFDYGVFTNIESDHIGPHEHASFEEYLECKKLLLKSCKVGFVNRDDPHYDAIVQGHTCTLETFGHQREADLRATHARNVKGPGYLGIAFDVEGLMQFAAEVHMPGDFSIHNSLTAIAICRRFGVSADVIIRSLKEVRVKGRVELVKVSDDYTVLIDYAHNALSMKSLLETLRAYKPHKLICLFGSAGGRDRARRFEMGEISGRLADVSVLTSDDIRFERPEDIIADIETGIKKTSGCYRAITDRKEAIAYALSIAEKGDIVVLAGKGHETYQIVGDRKIPMDERKMIGEITGHDLS